MEHANSIGDLSPYVPQYKVMERNEPCFLKTYFSWDNTKSLVHLSSLILFYYAFVVLSDICHKNISRFLLQGYFLVTIYIMFTNKFHTLHRSIEIRNRSLLYKIVHSIVIWKKIDEKNKANW